MIFLLELVKRKPKQASKISAFFLRSPAFWTTAINRNLTITYQSSKIYHINIKRDQHLWVGYPNLPCHGSHSLAFALPAKVVDRGDHLASLATSQSLQKLSIGKYLEANLYPRQIPTKYEKKNGFPSPETRIITLCLAASSGFASSGLRCLESVSCTSHKLLLIARVHSILYLYVITKNK